MLRELLEPYSPVDEGQIMSFAGRYGLDLPSGYRDFLLKSNGGRPVPAAFPIEGFLNNPVDVIQDFFGLNATIPTSDLDHVMTKEVIGLIPKGILPIACTDHYDFVCIDLRKKGNPVVYWDRRPFWGNEVWNEDDLYPVAETFQMFLDSLHEYSPEATP